MAHFLSLVKHTFPDRSRRFFLFAVLWRNLRSSRSSPTDHRQGKNVSQLKMQTHDDGVTVHGAISFLFIPRGCFIIIERKTCLVFSFSFVARKPLNASWRWRDVRREMKRRRMKLVAFLTREWAPEVICEGESSIGSLFYLSRRNFINCQIFFLVSLFIKKNMILWPKWLRLWDEWETSSRDFCVIPEILPCIRVIALDSWKMQTAFQHCRWHYLATVPWEMTSSDSSTTLWRWQSWTLGAGDHEICMRGMRVVRNVWKSRPKKSDEDQEKFSQRAKPLSSFVWRNQSVIMNI